MSHSDTDAGPGPDADGRGVVAAAGDAPDPAEAPLPPGPDGLPLLGNTVAFFRDVFGLFDRLAEHGDVVRYSVAGYDFTTVLHPEHVERVLVSDAPSFRKSDIQRQSGVAFLEDGLLLTEGERWRSQRETMQPMFYRERVETYGDTMAAYAAERAASWDDGEVIDAVDEFSELSLSILARTLFDVDVRDRRSAIRDAAAAVQAKSDPSTLAAFVPTWVPTRTNRRFRRGVRGFAETVDDLVAERRASDDGADRDDLLSLLLAVADDPESPVDETELRDHLMTFLLAGHETTSLALAYTFFVLAQHPEHAERLRDEVDALDGRPTATDTADLGFTEAVVREAMRRYPPVHVLFRQPREDTTVGGYRVPADTTVTLPQFRLHADERFWDDPEAFRPERWLDGEGGVTATQADRPEYAYFPFGGGPRHCLGMRFAVLELRLVVATLARRVTVDLVSSPDLDFTPATTLHPADPIRLRVRTR